jgi:hypothetical protein
VTNDNNEFEEMEKLVDSVFAEEGIYSLTKLDAVKLSLSIEIIKMLDELEKQLENESYSKDYLGGLKHARAEIKNRWKEIGEGLR